MCPTLAFNSIEWIPEVAQGRDSCEGEAELSIPLNGFATLPAWTSCRPRVFQFHWMDSFQAVYRRKPRETVYFLSIPLNGFTINITTSLIMGMLAFQFHWMDSPRHKVRVHVLDSRRDFQFHWMDSRWGGSMVETSDLALIFQFHWMDSISYCLIKFLEPLQNLSIPLNGFWGDVSVLAGRLGVGFQFHWMDSGCLYCTP